MENIGYKINPKENLYFAIRLIVSIIGYCAIASMLFALGTLLEEKEFILVFTLFFYAGIIALAVFISSGLLVGHIKGNGVKITEKQFPDIYAIIEKQCRNLKIEVPSSYILESGGVLNAFATKFVGRNYVVIYSEILELAYEQGQEALEFIIAHELGHVKRKHMTKRVLLFPSVIIPFLSSAYSRACEYTCDNIGKSLSPDGATDGLLILAAGKKLYTKVDAEEYINNERYEVSFWKWFAEKTSSHPNLPKRLNNIGIYRPILPKKTEQYIPMQTPEIEDYSRFMPK